MKKSIILLAAAALLTAGANARIIRDNVLKGYQVGDVLEKGDFTEGVDSVAMNTWYGAKQGKPWTVASATIKPELNYDGYQAKGLSVDLGVKSGEKGTRCSIYPVTKKKNLGKGVYYMSCLVNLDKLGDRKATELFGLSAHGAQGKNRPALQAIKGADGKIKFIVALNKLTEQAPGSYELGKTHLVVLKADLDNKTASIYIDPKGDSEPSKADATVEADADNTLQPIRALTIKNRSGQAGSLGKIRLTDSWADIFAPAAEQ